VVEQIAALVDPTPLYFWGTHNGAELDLLFTVDGRTIGIDSDQANARRRGSVGRWGEWVEVGER